MSETIPDKLRALAFDELAARSNGAVRNHRLLSTLPPLIDVGDWIETKPPDRQHVIINVLDAGSILLIIGPSKSYKTFYTLQLLMSLASGRDFLGWMTTGKRKVLMVQLEMKDSSMHRRVNRMGVALQITRTELQGYFYMVNGRGIRPDIDELGEIIRKNKIEIVCIDPLYCIFEGDENAASDMSDQLRSIARLAEEYGATVLLVHHDKKGVAGALNIRDRGSGSGVLGRFYDSCITLTPHESGNPNLIVVETLLRDFPSQGARTVEFRDYCFQNSEAPPIPQAHRKTRNPTTITPTEELAEKVLSTFRERLWSPKELRERIRSDQGTTVEKTRQIVKYLESLDECVRLKKGNRDEFLATEGVARQAQEADPALRIVRK